MRDDPRIWLDYVFPAIVVIPTLLGLWAGLVRQLLPLVGLAAAFVGAIRFHAALGARLGAWLGIESDRLANVVAFGLVLGVVWLGFRLVAALVERMLQGSPLSGLNRLLGGLLGLLKGGLVAVALAYAIQLIAPQDHPQIAGSFWYARLIDFSETTLRPLLPEASFEALKERAQTLREEVEGRTQGVVRDVVEQAVDQAVQQGTAATKGLQGDAGAKTPPSP